MRKEFKGLEDGKGYDFKEMNGCRERKFAEPITLL